MISVSPRVETEIVSVTSRIANYIMSFTESEYNRIIAPQAYSEQVSLPLIDYQAYRSAGFQRAEISHSTHRLSSALVRRLPACQTC